MLVACPNLELRRATIHQVPRIEIEVNDGAKGGRRNVHLIGSEDNLRTWFHVISNERWIDCNCVENVAERDVNCGRQEENNRGNFVALYQKFRRDSVGRHKKSGDAFACHQCLRVLLLWQESCESVERTLLNRATYSNETHCCQVDGISRLSRENVPCNLAQRNKYQSNEGNYISWKFGEIIFGQSTKMRADLPNRIRMRKGAIDKKMLFKRTDAKATMM